MSDSQTLEGAHALERSCIRWLEKPALQFATALVAAIVIGLGSATQLYVNWTMTGIDASFSGLVVMKVVEFGCWAAVVPVVVAVDRRNEWSDGWFRTLLVHLALATVFFLLINIPATLLMKVGDVTVPGLPFRDRYVFRTAYRLPSSSLTYFAILAVVSLMRAFVRSRRLDRDLARAQLQVLREQLQPHFLFNTLHTAGSLVRAGDREGAVDVLAALGDLLRRSLRHGTEGEVTLREEMTFLEQYLQIHRRRFGEHLAVDVDYPDSLGEHPVPAFLVQPLVENAIRHGLDLDTTHGDVRVVARRAGASLELRVEDSGGRLDGLPDAEDREGVGLTNLQQRLTTLYEGRASLSAQVVNGRTIVTVILPVDGDT